MAHIRRLLACAIACVALLSSCAGGDGGSGTIQVASGFSMNAVDAADRTGKPVLAKELAGARWEWLRREDQSVGVRVGEGPATPEQIDAMLGGKVAVVNFWGSWCGPCRREQRQLESLWREYRDRHGRDAIQFLGVNTRRDQRIAAVRYLEEFDVTYPSVFNPDSRIASEFLVRFMPATYVIDKQGRIAARIIGAVQNEVELRKLLDAELKR